ncbi:sensor histidine kinase [Alkalihalobacillus sp. 1P02AB]|uniref:sensor histidine kinase n=1 Tax=Alkalihalobacillus sp. 1P02AB TaxID=3132260 RepID=UPI0039A42133
MEKLEDPIWFVNGWRFLNLIVLTHLWYLGEQGIEGFILIILLAIMVCLRYRYELPVWTIIIDTSICLFFVPFNPAFIFGLSFPLFEFSLKGKWLFVIPVGLIIILQGHLTGLLFWYLLQAFFFGLFAYYAFKNRSESLLEADFERRARYELEQVKLDLLEAYSEVAQIAEVKERNRISRDLHDHLGHDLTGALLALQAYEHVDDEEKAIEMLKQVKERITRSTKRLRETVHNMTPVTLMEMERFEQIINDVESLEVKFLSSGNIELAPIHVSVLLESCLKEALTNVVRHSNATKVEVDLDITETIARLRVQDNGSVKKKSKNGSGLRSLQLRARALKGSLTIDRSNGYLLVCVLPITTGRLKN